MYALTASFLSILLMTPLAGGWLGVYLDAENDQAVISEVIPGTPAARAGLKAGDILLAVGDIRTPTREDFIAAIEASEAGARSSIRLTRNGRKRVVMVRLGDRPAQVGVGSVEEAVEEDRPKPSASGRAPRRSAPVVEGKPAPQGPKRAATPADGYLGIRIREVGAGLVVDEVLAEGPCATSGLRAGDQLVSLGDYRIGSLEDLDRALRALAPGRRVAIGVKSEGGAKSLMVRVGRRPGAAVGRELRENKAVPIVEVPPQEAGPPADAAKPPPEAARAGPSKPKAAEYDLEGELKALRSELQELRKLLKELRRTQNGRE